MAATPYLAWLLEFYLPPSLDSQAVASVARGALRPLLEVVDRWPRAPLTAALDPGFTRALLRHGQGGLLASLATAVERGQIELAGGTYSHSLLPRLPVAEMERQIRRGHEAMKEAMGRSWRPQGFVPPALAYARKVAETVANRGMRWLVADELALGRLGEAPTQKVAVLGGRPDALLFFRDRKLSATLAAGAFPDAPALKASMARDLGRRRRGYRVAVVPATAFVADSPALRLFEDTLRGRGPLLSQVSTLAEAFPDREAVEPLPSSWRTTPRELEAGIPFAPWSSPDNELHALLWRLVGLGLEAIGTDMRHDDPPWTRMRTLLDEGLQTAPFRFASARPWWDASLVKASAWRLASAVEAGGDLVPAAAREEVASTLEKLNETVDRWEAEGLVERRRATTEIAPGTIEAELVD